MLLLTRYPNIPKHTHAHTPLNTQSMQDWLNKQSVKDKIETIWVPLSLFDVQSQFTFRFRNLVLDVKIEREKMSVSSFDGGFCQVSFYSEEEFRIFLRMELTKQLKAVVATESETAPPPPEASLESAPPVADIFN